MPDFHVSPEDPMAPELDLLFSRHRAFCHADTPPESIHMLDREALAGEGMVFLALRQACQPVAMGALKMLDDGAVELKSMHVLEEARGTGAASRMLAALIAAAWKQGAMRIYLETGAQPSFAPARRFYLRSGFVECPPFAGYRPDPMSSFMMLDQAGFAVRGPE